MLIQHLGDVQKDIINNGNKLDNSQMSGEESFRSKIVNHPQLMNDIKGIIQANNVESLESDIMMAENIISGGSEDDSPVYISEDKYSDEDN